MSKNENIVLNPWNPKNRLLTEDDVYTILEKGGFDKAREVIKINNLGYYQTAFIHPSYVKKHIFEASVNNNITLAEQPGGVLDLFDENNNYENHEFLGDRVLDMSAAFYICRKYPDQDQGFKTVLKTKLVRKNSLAKFAKYLDFPQHLIISKQVEENTNQGRMNDRILEDVMEAFICGLFIDQNETPFFSEIVTKLENQRLIGPGWQIANAFIENVIESVVDFEALLLKEENYKEQLLQYYQKEFKLTPEYVSISVEGPPHNRIFTEGVLDKEGDIISKGVGKKKQDAQQHASLGALKYFGVIL
tara:strand:+ start:1664 stop:2575 length:912 start_codon:yes stop_codon:yes gene_type:complete